MAGQIQFCSICSVQFQGYRCPRCQPALYVNQGPPNISFPPAQPMYSQTSQNYPPALTQSPQLQEETTWTCLSCNKSNRESITTCPMCGNARFGTGAVQMQQAYPAVPNASNPTPQSTWRCSICNYQYNLTSHCYSCKQPNPSFQPSYQPSPSPSSYQSSPQLYQSNPSYLSSNPSSASLPAAATGSVSKQTHWVCAACQTRNLMLNPYCNNCGGPKPVGSFVEIRCSLKVSRGCWVCDACGFDRNWPNFNTCKQCNDLNAVGRQIIQHK